MNGVLLSASLLLAIQPIQTQLKRKSTELVEQLGDSSFRKRESASKELIVLGSNSKEALETGSRSSDPEIKARCKALLAEAQKNYLTRRIKQFQSDVECSLPGWKTFSQNYGSDNLARKVYGRMAEKGGERFFNYETNAKDAALFFKDVYQQFHREAFALNHDFNRITDGKIIELCTLFYLKQDKKISGLLLNIDDEFKNQITSLPITYFTQSDTLLLLSTKKAESPIFKKILFSWIEHTAQEIAVQSLGYDAEFCLFLDSIRYNKIKEAAPILRKLLKDPNFTKQNVRTKGYALHALANLALKDDAALFESYLQDDSSTLYLPTGNIGNSITYTVQARDIALAAIIHLSHEKFEDFGFEGWQSSNEKGISSDILAFSFVSEENRKKAFQKWYDLKEKKAKESQPMPKK